MKKLLLLLLGFAIGFFICYYYCNNPQNEIEMTKPEGIITSEQAKALSQAFDTRHQLISDSIVRRPDNRSAWWSLDDMEAFIKLAKAESTALGYDMNGIRVYLGAHGNIEKQIGYTTMFMVPTGTPSVSEGSSMKLKVGNGDVPGGNGLNDGGDGTPPSASYPQ